MSNFLLTTVCDLIETSKKNHSLAGTAALGICFVIDQVLREALGFKGRSMTGHVVPDERPEVPNR
jgi:hypothetical protein